MTRDHPPSRLTDSELVRACRGGSPAAWNELVERYARYVHAICVRAFRLRDDDAEDAFQEVFLRVHTRLGTLRDESALRPWIAQLARRVCLDRLAAAAKEAPVEDAPEWAHEAIDEIDEALTIRQALEELGDPCAELLDRFFARDESYRTIAEQLDIPSGTIASRISRCLGKLRMQLEGRKHPSRASGRETA